LCCGRSHHEQDENGSCRDTKHFSSYKSFQIFMDNLTDCLSSFQQLSTLKYFLDFELGFHLHLPVERITLSPSYGCRAPGDNTQGYANTALFLSGYCSFEFCAGAVARLFAI